MEQKHLSCDVGMRRVQSHVNFDAQGEAKKPEQTSRVKSSLTATQFALHPIEP